MNHRRAQYTKRESERSVFLQPHTRRRGWEPEPARRPHLSLAPRSRQPPLGGANHWHQPLLRADPPPAPHRWPNLRLDPAPVAARPSAAPRVLCGSRSNPANLHNDEALQCGPGLRRVGKKYALSFREAHRRLSAAREEWGARRVERGCCEEPAARPPRTVQVCHLLSPCPAGPAEEGLPRAVNQQEVRFIVPASDSGRTDPGHSDRHQPAG